jgi:nucleoside-diphosphate-sugar epimerase
MSYHIFVTGGSGFIGRSVVQHAIAAGHQVDVLTRSEKSSERIRQAGATPIIGDLGQRGPWQEAVGKAQMIIHLAQPETYGEKVTRQRAEKFREQRVMMDRMLLDSLRKDTVQRIVYVGGTSYYGHQGEKMVDEDVRPNPKGWGPYVAPAIEMLDQYVAQGLPIIQGFPSWVYGPGSWYQEYQLETLSQHKPVVGLRGYNLTISVSHIEDTARALLHLMDHGEIGKRYFIADDQPIPSSRLVELTARALGVTSRSRLYPKFLAQFALGPVITESLTTEVRLSNARIKKTGFVFEFPTTEQGIPDVVKRWKNAAR